MSLYKQWLQLMENQTQETFDAFWEEYSSTETRVYKHILAHKDEHLAGKFSDLTAQFKADPVIFMGFLDGINSSLNQENDLESITEDTELDLDVDFEKLAGMCVKYAVSGKRKYDMALRLFYADVCDEPKIGDEPAFLAVDFLKSEAEVVYLLVNYTVIFDAENKLIKLHKEYLKKGGQGYEKS